MTSSLPNANHLVVYPAPTGADLSGDYILRVNGRPIDVYRGVTWQPDFTPSYGGDYSFAYFDFSGSVIVEVISSVKPLSATRILPFSRKVTPTIDGNRLTFELTQTPSYLSIEPDGKNGPLLLFANPLEEDIPSPDDPRVRYYGPGIHEVGEIRLSSGETLYIAGGAVVRGGILASGRDIRIAGRGIIDGLSWPRRMGPTDNIVKLFECDNVQVDGIIVKDGWLWNVNICGCSDVTVSRLKLIASRCENNDGIDICNSRHVLVEDSFIRSDDDCIAPKGFGYRNHQAVEDIVVRRTALWSDKAHIWRIGCECRAEAMRNMRFEDIDVLHYSDNWWTPGDLPDEIDMPPVWDDIPVHQIDLPTCISIQPAEDMIMENIRFERIRIHHEGQRWFMEIMPKATQWALKRTPGRLRNCVFSDIVIEGTGNGWLGGIRICGPDAEHPVEELRFERVVRHGEPLTANAPEQTIRGFVRNIQYVTS